MDLLTLLLTYSSVLLRFFLVEGESGEQNLRTIYHILSGKEGGREGGREGTGDTCAWKL
mgnify:CR=1 FL=1